MTKRDALRRRGSDELEATCELITPASRGLSTLGAEASDRWLCALGLPAVPRWYVEIAIATDADTSFELNIYAEEWGFAFHHGGRCSWVRVTDIPFIHGRDQFHLLARTPDLLAINLLAAELELEHDVALLRASASIRSNVPDATEVVRDWLLQPLPYATVKKTVELCSDEMHRGIRCTRPKGHPDEHEYVAGDVSGQLRWK